MDAVVVAVGNYSEPNLPACAAAAGACPARQLHCHNFRTPSAFAGQTVLVVGASFSGAPAPAPPALPALPGQHKCSQVAHLQV